MTIVLEKKHYKQVTTKTIKKSELRCCCQEREEEGTKEL